MALTVEGIQRAKPKAKGDRWLTDKTGERNAGRLTVRISPAGTKRFYFRYASGGDGARTPIALGVFSPDKPAPPGFMTLEDARAEFRRLSELHKAKGSRDVKAHLAKVERDRKRAEEAEARRQEQERTEAEAARVYNLRALAAEYVANLEQRGKVRSAQDARNIFKNHLNGKALADKPAREVERAEITALLRSLVESGKVRTAGKLRSYLRAAYATAMRAEGDAAAPSAMIAFRIGANPVADTKSLPVGTRDRTLADAELSAYWQRLADVKSDAARGALQLALLLGGQRIAQIVRLTRADIDLSAGFLTLRDPKGKREQPRVHELPITSAAMAILRPLVKRAETLESDWIFTSEGKKAIFPDTLTAEARDIASAMKKAKESPDAFRLSDIRRTAETMMARMGITQDVRAQIQSHGLGGVQARHYNRHDYRLEKREALTQWARKVTSKPKAAPVMKGSNRTVEGYKRPSRPNTISPTSDAVTPDAGGRTPKKGRT